MTAERLGGGGGVEASPALNGASGGGHAAPGSLVCLRCHAEPETALALNRAQGQLIHTATVGAASGGTPIVCGGLVVPRGMEQLSQAHAPGDVVLCFADNRSVVPHLVRLGPPVPHAPGWWRGTPVCGTPSLLREKWMPLLPAVANATDPCEKCRKARDAGVAM